MAGSPAEDRVEPYHPHPKKMKKHLFAGAFALSAVPPQPAFAAAPPPSTIEEPTATSPKILEAFEVTGSLIKRTDIEGPSPVHVVSQEEIERTGMSNLTDVMRELPEAAMVSINESQAAGAFVRGASAIDLRGLGANNTLILVDGRRQAPNGIGVGGTVFVDPNRFPTVMTARIEVLKDGASAVYGADAIAGVVNIITRKNYSGAEVSARYGNYFKTDGGEQSYSFLAGTGKGPAHVTVALASTSRHANAAVDQPFSASANQTERWRAYDAVKYARLLSPTNRAFDFRSSGSPYATVGVPTLAQLTANGLTAAAIINPLTNAPSTFLPGTGGVPQGTIGRSSTSNPSSASVPFVAGPARPTAAQFVPAVFRTDQEGNLFDTQPYAWLVPERRARSISTNFTYEIGQFAQFYASVSYARSESESQFYPLPISTVSDNDLLVPASNYYNPFGIPVTFTFRTAETGPSITKVVDHSLGYVAGLKGTWRGRFDWDLGYSSTKNDRKDTQLNGMSESRLRAALAKSTPDAFNIFGGPTFKQDPATLESIKVKTYAAGDATTSLFDFHVSTSELFALPWGKVGGSVAVEHRAEEFNTNNDPLSSTFNDIIFRVRFAEPTSAHRTVDSAAAELRVPLVREGRFRFAHTVEISGAARFETFSDGYDSGVNPSVGLRFRPLRALLLRATYGKNFRVPTLSQLYAGYTDNVLTGVADLRRPSALTRDPNDASTASYRIHSGGNPLLVPETGRNKTLGVLFEAPWKRLRGLSLEYTHGVIEQHNVITSVGTLFIRQNELTSTGNLVVRDPGSETYTNTTTAPIPILSGADGATTLVQPGQTVTVPGRVQYINTSAINLASQVVRYHDLTLGYTLRTTGHGLFRLSSNWTYYGYFGKHVFAADPFITRVGRDLPRYRGQSSLSWQRGQWGANTGMNYTHRHRDLIRDGWEVGRYYTFSAGLNYACRKDSLLGDTRISVGVDNLFGRQPPLDYTSSGYDPALVGRPGGRFGFVSVRKSY